MKRHAFVLLALAVLAGGRPAAAVVLGQVDDFEDGTTQGWVSGGGLNPNPPTNVADGGPAGAGDNFLRIRGNGILANAGGKPVALNAAQWSGNYNAAGVLQISANVRNSGATQLDLRLLISRDPLAGGQRYLTSAVILPAGSGWVRATWRVDAANLIQNPADFNPPVDPALALAQVEHLRIFHNPAASFPGPEVVADLGVDNIRAESGAADRDGDGIPDASDNCPFFANPSQTDTDRNGRGNACECGDQNGDGTVNVLDLVAINLAIFNPPLRTPLCDANNDDLCTVVDIVAANNEIFSPGNTSVCARQPVPGP